MQDMFQPIPGFIRNNQEQSGTISQGRGDWRWQSQPTAISAHENEPAKRLIISHMLESMLELSGDLVWHIIYLLFLGQMRAGVGVVLSDVWSEAHSLWCSNCLLLQYHCITP